MSFSGRTPESLLPRSDSRNPATTCKGITTNGRPCRRGLATSPKSSPLSLPGGDDGVLAMLDESDAAAFYCWQHKAQAEDLAAQPEQRTSLYTLKERSSIDTLINRVGLLNLDEQVAFPKKARHRHRRSDQRHLTRRDTLPSGWHKMQGPLMSVPEDVKPKRPPRQNDYTGSRSNVGISWLCCIRLDYEDDSRQSRPLPRRNNGAAQGPQHASPAPMQAPFNQQEVRRKPVSGQQQRMLQRPSPARLSSQPPSAQPTSQTQALLSLIPTTLSPQTTSALLAELSRPISPHDEAGYIYIFWLTLESEASKPDDETASSLLDDDDDDDEKYSSIRHERTTTTLQRYASVRAPTAPKTIMLKIGRAANVHRRLSQWTKQCGQNITLVRFYPYSPSQKVARSASPSRTARKVPHVHRVERLIHLELAEKRAQKKECGQCGQEHKEWFEVEASKKGLRGVDEVARRWIGWAETAGVDGGRAEAGTSRSLGATPVDGYY